MRLQLRAKRAGPFPIAMHSAWQVQEAPALAQELPVACCFAALILFLLMTPRLAFAQGGRDPSQGTGYPDRSCGGHVTVPLLVSIPSLIRMRQCLIEFFRARRSPIPF